MHLHEVIHLMALASRLAGGFLVTLGEYRLLAGLEVVGGVGKSW